jgi:formylglycine-generating enzyme required for sulfatase activity/serine/threonine protein kinase
MIAFTCPGCGKRLQVKDELAGRKVQCPGCGKVAIVPQAAAVLPSRIEPLPTRPPEVRTSPRGAPIDPDDSTLPPKARGQAAQESLSDAIGQTHLGVGHQGEVTQALPEQGSSQDLYDFLAPAEQPDEIGRLGGYRILKVLGAGGMGVVFQAEDPRLKRNLAIKAMLPALAASRSARQRFLREAQIAAAIENDHIVAIHQVGEDRGVPFIAMPFLKGEPLNERLKHTRLFPVAEVLRIGRETAKGLAAAHTAGLVHRDIKPANLWLEDTGEPGASATGGRVKILDFGLARAASDESHLTQTGAVVGTPAYMAPEQAAGEAVDGRCDLFSLGCVLYRLCTGITPFKGRDSISTLVAVATEKPQPPLKINPDVPPALSELVMYLLAKKPEQRPKSAQAVAAALQEIEEQTASSRSGLPSRPLRATGPARHAGPTGVKKRLPLSWLVGAGVLGLVVLVAAIVLFWQTPHGTVRIESDDPSIEIVFDQTGPTIKGADKEPITLRAGKHSLLVKRGDFSFETDKLLIKKGQTTTLKIELLGRKVRIVQDDQELGSREIPLPKNYTNSLGMEFVLIPKGKSWLGGGSSMPGEQEVEILHDFYLGKYEVTQEEWQNLIGHNASHFSRTGADKDSVKDVSDADLKRFPIEWVTWEWAHIFVERLNKKLHEPGWTYRLPREVEWEYACRGGPMADKRASAFDFCCPKATNALLPAEANYSHGQVLKGPCKVGSYKPNPLGLYDMHGNVSEWCETQMERKNPQGASIRATRGGSWFSGADLCRAAARSDLARDDLASNTLGMRLARVPVGQEIVKIAAEDNKSQSGEAKLPPPFTNSLGMEFMLVPKGKSWLGGGGGKPGHKEVEILQDFYLGKYQVTQEEWEKVMGNNPSVFCRSGAFAERLKDIPDAELKRFPVDSVSWDDAQQFIQRVNQQTKEAGWLYRLPAEVEWEYGCRGGPMVDQSESIFDFYVDKPTHSLLPSMANFGHVLNRTCKVGSYKPNRLGLHDMHGNGWEWCDDEVKVDKGNSLRVGRGGTWWHGPPECRAAGRHPAPSSRRFGDRGLRLARVPVGKEIVKIAAEEKKPPPEEAKLPPPFKNSLGMEFVLVPKGKSWLGGGGGKPGEQEVEIPRDFYLGKYEVTQEEWQIIMGSNPSTFQAVPGGANEDLKRFPVETVSWEDCQVFITRLNEKEKGTAWIYRLPTEVEWEYACRGGPMKDKLESTFDFYLEKATDTLSPVQANFEFRLKRTCKVGSYPPNRLGLYDMHGNVYEWCQDEAPNPKDPKQAARRSRGGGYANDAASCWASHRHSGPASERFNNLGLRLARVPTGKGGN